MKYSKIAEPLDKIIYLIGKQGISQTQETQTHTDTKKNTLKLLGHTRALSLPKNSGPECVLVVSFFKEILQVVFYTYVSIYMVCENKQEDFLFLIILE